MYNYERTKTALDKDHKDALKALQKAPSLLNEATKALREEDTAGALEVMSNLVKSLDKSVGMLGVQIRGGKEYAKALKDMSNKLGVDLG